MKKRNTACLRVTRIHAITHYALRRIHMTLRRIMRDDAPIRIMRSRIHIRTSRPQDSATRVRSHHARYAIGHYACALRVRRTQYFKTSSTSSTKIKINKNPTRFLLVDDIKTPSSTSSTKTL